MERAEARVSGIINIDKPYGMGSMDVVRRIKRASGFRRVGHGGTLDPVATGVIPICIGQATRMMEYLVGGTKEYRAEVELGSETDTYDALGRVTGRGDPSRITLDDVVETLGRFQGTIQQVPPMYSALKRQGQRLYELARAGIEVEREPRTVQVLDIRVRAWSPPTVTLEVSCGRGLYMRSLAHDLGRALGCGAHLKGLVRLRTGPFRVSDSVALAEAERMFEEGTWQDILHAPDTVVGDLRALIVGRRSEEMIRDGRPVSTGPRIPPTRPGEECRVYSVDGRFVAIVTFDGATRQWRPQKVLSLDYDDGEELEGV